MKNSNNTLIGAAIISGLINFGGIYELYKIQNMPIGEHKKDSETEVIFDFNEIEQKTYLDSTINTEKKIDSDNISDKSSESDSNMQGNDDGIMPKAPIKDLLSQTKREAFVPLIPSLEHYEKIERTVKEITEQDEMQREEAKVKDKVSILEKVKFDKEKKEKPKEKKAEEHIDPEKALENIKDTSVALNQPPSLLKDDLFPLPMISIGEKTLSKLGFNSFEMSESNLGKYLKKVREKLGLKFYQMIFFHYRSNFIFTSKVRINFVIFPDGKVGRVSSDFIEGDAMFKDYCLTVINSATPFAPFPKNIEPFLEDDGVLKMDILFGYNVQEK